MSKEKTNKVNRKDSGFKDITKKEEDKESKDESSNTTNEDIVRDIFIEEPEDYENTMFPFDENVKNQHDDASNMDNIGELLVNSAPVQQFNSAEYELDKYRKAQKEKKKVLESKEAKEAKEKK